MSFTKDLRMASYVQMYEQRLISFDGEMVMTRWRSINMRPYMLKDDMDGHMGLVYME
jgi:hypothetical protein